MDFSPLLQSLLVSVTSIAAVIVSNRYALKKFRSESDAQFRQVMEELRYKTSEKRAQQLLDVANRFVSAVRSTLVAIQEFENKSDNGLSPSFAGHKETFAEINLALDELMLLANEETSSAAARVRDVMVDRFEHGSVYDHELNRSREAFAAALRPLLRPREQAAVDTILPKLSE